MTGSNVSIILVNSLFCLLKPKKHLVYGLHASQIDTGLTAGGNGEFQKSIHCDESSEK
jgi:hypothetical protein